MIVLREDPLLKGSLRFNLLNQRIDIVRKLWWNDGITSMTDAARDFFYLYFEQFYSLGNEKNMDKALRAEANSKQYHPICEYELSKYESFTFIKGNIANKELITEIFTKYKPAVVVNLAAQAGVRYSITNPDAYVEANLIGFYNILEACRHSYDDGETGVEHLVCFSGNWII